MGNCKKKKQRNFFSQRWSKLPPSIRESWKLFGELQILWKRSGKAKGNWNSELRPKHPARPGACVRKTIYLPFSIYPQNWKKSDEKRLRFTLQGSFLAPRFITNHQNSINQLIAWFSASRLSFSSGLASEQLWMVASLTFSFWEQPEWHVVR